MNPIRCDQPDTINKAKCFEIAYVVMSRPKYILAFAAYANNIILHNTDLKKNGWEIVSDNE